MFLFQCVINISLHMKENAKPPFPLELSRMQNPVPRRGAPAPLRGPILLGDSPQVGGGGRQGGASHAAV
jgi:hypothetical protein